MKIFKLLLLSLLLVLCTSSKQISFDFWAKVESNGQKITRIVLYFKNNNNCRMTLPISIANSIFLSESSPSLSFYLIDSVTNTVLNKPLVLAEGINWGKLIEPYTIEKGETLAYEVPLMLYDNESLNIGYAKYLLVRYKYNGLKNCKGEKLEHIFLNTRYKL